MGGRNDRGYRANVPRDYDIFRSQLSVMGGGADDGDQGMEGHRAKTVQGGRILKNQIKLP